MTHLSYQTNPPPTAADRAEAEATRAYGEARDCARALRQEQKLVFHSIQRAWTYIRCVRMYGGSPNADDLAKAEAELQGALEIQQRHAGPWT